MNITGGTVSGAGFGIAGQGNFTIGQGATVTGDIGVLVGGYIYVFGGLPIIDVSSGISSSVTVGGTVTGTGGTAVTFGATLPDTFTLHPTAVINGIVDGGVAELGDVFRLGGPGSGTFDVGLIGPAAQYRGFESFSKADGST